jgi:hypothetical protein
MVSVLWRRGPAMLRMMQQEHIGWPQTHSERDGQFDRLLEFTVIAVGKRKQTCCRFRTGKKVTPGIEGLRAAAEDALRAMRPRKSRSPALRRGARCFPGCWAAE